MKCEWALALQIWSWQHAFVLYFELIGKGETLHKMLKSCLLRSIRSNVDRIIFAESSFSLIRFKLTTSHASTSVYNQKGLPTRFLDSLSSCSHLSIQETCSVGTVPQVEAEAVQSTRCTRVYLKGSKRRANTVMGMQTVSFITWSLLSALSAPGFLCWWEPSYSFI